MILKQTLPKPEGKVVNTTTRKCQYLEFSWSVFSRIQSECEKMRTRKTPNTDAFYAVYVATKGSRDRAVRNCLTFEINILSIYKYSIFSSSKPQIYQRFSDSI